MMNHNVFGHLKEYKEGKVDTNRMKGKNHGVIYKTMKCMRTDQTCQMHREGFMFSLTSFHVVLVCFSGETFIRLCNKMLCLNLVTQNIYHILM